MSTVLDKRYLLQEKLGEGGMGLVYLATDRLTKQTVALKSVKAEAQNLSFNSMSNDSNFSLALAHEFQTLASLRHPHIISVLDYGFDQQQQPYFTMEYIEGARTILEAAAGKTQAEQIALLIQLSQALLYLHRRGVLHRDLKPGNVLVDATGAVKVVDFGLALSTKLAAEANNGIAGTMAYMSPELFAEPAPSVASDLYAIGVIAYEIITGKLPFDASNISRLIMDILQTEPDLSLIPEELYPVIARLLEKDPELRYPSAEALILALCEATGQAVPSETQAIRESFLQAAKFVGREQELNTLVEAMQRSMDAQSSFYLLGGESGIGKSRLLDELRIQAVVTGALVLKGQAVSEGGAPYQVWREPFRFLISYADLSDEEASVFKALVPDTEALLGRAIPDAAPLDPQNSQARLFNQLLAILCRQPAFLCILEDLHWESSESLALLQFLQQNLSGMSALFIGTYRHDERPELANTFNEVKLILLERLPEKAVAELSSAILGERGENPALLALLQRETEGNAFFLVEVMRTLAEEAGQLDQINSQSLPTEVFARGIQAILQRRFRSLPEDSQKILQLAAVTGRQIDLKLLKALDSNQNLDNWLNICSNAAVLEVRDDRWRFAHDKLRQELLNSLSNDEKRNSHRLVAEAIESTYPNQPEYSPALANHWNMAENPLKALQYTVQAGQQASNNAAYTEVVRYFSRALQLLQNLPAGAERDSQEVALQVGLGLAIASSEGYGSENVLAPFTRVRELAMHLENNPQLAPALMGIWVYYFSRAQYHEAAQISEQLIKLAPKSDFPALITVAGNALHAGVYYGLGEYERALALARQAIEADNPELDRAMINTFQHHLGVVATIWAAHNLQILGYPEQAQAYLDEAPRRIAIHNHPQNSAIVLSMMTTSLLLGEDIEAVINFGSQAIALSEEYGLLFWLAYASPNLGWAEAKSGKPKEGLERIRKGRELYHMIGSCGFDSHFMGLQAEIYQELGQHQEAFAIIGEAFAHAERYHETLYIPELYRIQSVSHLAMGDAQAAETSLRKAIEIAHTSKAKRFELRAAMALVQLLHSSEAYRILSQVYASFTEGFANPELQAAKAVLDKA